MRSILTLRLGVPLLHKTLSGELLVVEVLQDMLTEPFGWAEIRPNMNSAGYDDQA